MELQEIKLLLQMFMTELRCEITGWEDCIPLEALKHWMKRVDARIISRINDND